MYYRDLILVIAIAVVLLIIILTIVVPVLFRLCWNKCAKNCMKCNKGKRKHKKLDDEWVGGSNALVESTKYGVTDTSEIYGRYVSPTLPAQIIIYLYVPFYVMWIIFFIVWTLLFLDFIKRYHAQQLKKEEDISMKEKPKSSTPKKEKKFDAYEAAGIERGGFKQNTKRYLHACKKAFAKNKLAVILGVISIVIITGISTNYYVFSSCMCVASSPVELSSYLSRRVGHKYCVEGEICNVYFTLADTERDMIVNFHISEEPEWAFTVYDTVSHSRSEFITDGDWVSSYAFRTNATTYKMDTVRELTRYVNWADITNLTPDTTYYFVAAYIIDGTLIVTEKEYKVKSIPGDGTFTFVTGGDMSVDGDGEKLVRNAAAIQPDFAIIVGDNAYDNGFKSCYLRWDKWFDRWEHFMSQNSGGYSIPMLLGIGNHEAGKFGANPGDDPYYSAYFPQKHGLQNEDPRLRLPYHSHRFGVNTTFVILDTDTVVRMDGVQTEWLESQLSVPSKLKIVLYHGNLYPSSKMDFEISKIGRKNWAPLFDKYNVSMAFENHLHLYKRTKPLKDNKVDPDGVTYFGDGAWGVMTNIVELSDKFYIEEVSRKQHFFHVEVQNSEHVSLRAIEKNGNAFDTWEKTIPY